MDGRTDVWMLPCALAPCFAKATQSINCDLTDLQNWDITSDLEADGYKIMDKFVELGGNFFDTANAYENGSSERVIGNWMKK